MTENYQRTYIIGLAAALLLATPVQARFPYQFQHFFPSWGDDLTRLRDSNCSAQRDAYKDPNNEDPWAPYNLVECLLEEGILEFRKIEMSIVSVTFGLLPTVLMLMGPTTSEISLLARRRPLLAILLSVAMSSILPTEGNPYSNSASYLRKPVDISARPWVLARPSLWARVLVSAAEYAMAAGAAANMVRQSYLLATRAITVSTIALWSEPLPSSYGRFLWIVLIFIVHACGGFAAGLRYSDRRQAGPGLRRRLVNELTPCVYSDPVLLVPRRKTYLYVAAAYATRLGVVVLFLYGTIILSSQILISLRDSVPVISMYLAGAVVCRLILSIELHGMKEATSLSLQDTTEYTATERHPGMNGNISKMRTF